MPSVPETVDAFLESQASLIQGARLMIAVSGGPDSVALTRGILQARDRYQLDPIMVHIHHGLRGAEADDDEAMVRILANQLGLPYLGRRVDTRARMKATGDSMEMAARALRREAFASIAQERSIPFVATGHNADDQIELFFIRLLRGASPGGLAGMRAVDPHSFPSNLTILRPLFTASRLEIRQWLDTHEYIYRTDSSNHSLDPIRNRIRAELAPALKAIAPSGYRKPLRRVQELLADQSDWMRTCVDEWRDQNDRPPIQSLPPALARAIVAQTLNDHGVAPNFELIEKLRQAPDSPVSIAPNRRVSIDVHGVLSFSHPNLKNAAFNPSELKVSIEANAGVIHFESATIHWTRIAPSASQTPDFNQTPPTEEIFDSEAIGPNITLRHWRPGDRYHPIGMTQSVKLKEWFNKRKIPPERRRRLLLATDSQDRVFWIEGERISERHKVTEGANTLLSWRLEIAQE